MRTLLAIGLLLCATVGCAPPYVVGTLTYHQKAVIDGEEVELVTIKPDSETEVTFCDERCKEEWKMGERYCVKFCENTQHGGYLIAREIKKTDAPEIKSQSDYDRLRKESRPAPIRIN
jgi:hypothetical protein